MENKKLKILMLNYEFPPLGGGASPVSYEIAKGYVELGNEKSYKYWILHSIRMFPSDPSESLDDFFLEDIVTMFAGGFS